MDHCPECGLPAAVYPSFKIGRTNHAVCFRCGWCVTHQRYFPSSAKGERRPNLRGAVVRLEKAA